LDAETIWNDIFTDKPRRPKHSHLLQKDMTAIEILADHYHAAGRYLDEERLYRKTIGLVGSGTTWGERPSRVGGDIGFEYDFVFPKLIDSLEAQGKTDEALLEAENNHDVTLSSWAESNQAKLAPDKAFTTLNTT
jgi:hypothetical protein